MLFDIIEISEEELAKLKPAQMTLLRKAQQKQDELILNVQKKEIEYEEKLLTAGLVSSSVYMGILSEINGELNSRIATLADNLIYSMSLLDIKDEDKEDNKGESGSTGYLVDYSLSYNQRYVIVRNYYLAIEDRDVRMAKYGKDETAKKYLGTYYNTLYNILATYDK